MASFPIRRSDSIENILDIEKQARQTQALIQEDEKAFQAFKGNIAGGTPGMVDVLRAQVLQSTIKVRILENKEALRRLFIKVGGLCVEYEQKHGNNKLLKEALNANRSSK